MQKLPTKLRWILLLCVLATGLILAAGFRSYRQVRLNSANAAAASRNAILPATILWAWERPENFDFIDPQKVGVAFLARTVYLRDNRVIARPRLQPLTIPPGTIVIAVARIETDRTKRPTLSTQQVATATAEIAKLGRLPNVAAVQIDFDATVTERAFYRALLTKVRRELPQQTLLSITALASWCKGDNWLEDLPIDEAVPMLFRMGVERNQFLSTLAAGEPFSAKPCKESAGVSTDEPIAQLPSMQRVYVFNPDSWSTVTLKQTMETYQR
jgi:uncharacterized protein DUF3142